VESHPIEVGSEIAVAAADTAPAPAPVVAPLAAAAAAVVAAATPATPAPAAAQKQQQQQQQQQQRSLRSRVARTFSVPQLVLPIAATKETEAAIAASAADAGRHARRLQRSRDRKASKGGGGGLGGEAVGAGQQTCEWPEFDLGPSSTEEEEEDAEDDTDGAYGGYDLGGGAGGAGAEAAASVESPGETIVTLSSSDGAASPATPTSASDDAEAASARRHRFSVAQKQENRTKTLRRRRGVRRRISSVVRGVLSSDAGSLLGALRSTLAAIADADNSGNAIGRSSRLVPLLVLPASRLTWDTEETEVAVTRAEGAFESETAPAVVESSSDSLGESVSASASTAEEAAAAVVEGEAVVAPRSASMDFSGCNAELLRALAATPKARPSLGGGAVSVSSAPLAVAVAVASPVVAAVAVPEIFYDVAKASLPSTPAALKVIAMTPRD